MTLLEQFLFAVVSRVVAGVVAEPIKQALLKKLEQAPTDFRKALESHRTLQEEIASVCVFLAEQRQQLSLSGKEPLWPLLNNGEFHKSLGLWLTIGDLEEGHTATARLEEMIQNALVAANVPKQQIESQTQGLFLSIERSLFANPILAQWRHQRSLDYLREQVTQLRRLAEESAGHYSEERQHQVLNRYSELALKAWDIIDLSGLPEADLEVATQRLLLRQLYMPLRIKVVVKSGDADDIAAINEIEVRRDEQRLLEAGRTLTSSPKTEKAEIEARVGRRLAAARRLVVLADPGGGKTTMLRWLATTYLLRFRNNGEEAQVPDSRTLPSEPWIPVLIRCRDLGEDDLSRSFNDFLLQHLKKTELRHDEAQIMLSVILARMARGEALLLIDGLDEISSPRIRMMFCQELERTAARYPNAPIVVTSRIVGYRDMPYRMGAAFEHAVISPLSRVDKDRFAHRWVDVIESHAPPDDRAKYAAELIEALHSSDRIERLTGSPMLLTTLALVKRKVGKLPNRRTKLYAETVSVLLNWNSAHYEAVDEPEALPQLEYLAYDMCHRGVQRLPQSDVLNLFDKVRLDLPNNRQIRTRSSEEFLKLLEARSSIIIKSGGAWTGHANEAEPLWEFRHLTFQEYLAARALIDGRYDSSDSRAALAARVAPLVEHSISKYVGASGTKENAETWEEVFRLLICDCKDEDVDEVLEAIVNAAQLQPREESVYGVPIVSRHALIAMRCLTEEPNVSDAAAALVIDLFCRAVTSETYLMIRPDDEMVAPIAESSWYPLVRRRLNSGVCCAF